MANADKTAPAEARTDTHDSRRQPGLEPDASRAAASPETSVPPDGAAQVQPGEEPLMHAIGEAAERILEAFSSQFTVNDRRDAQIDTLHAELTKHRDDLLSKALGPIVKSFIQLHDEMGRAVDRLVRKPETEVSKEEATAILKGFQDEIALALARHDVEVFSENNVGRDFDGRRQTVIDHKDAAADDQAGKVAASLRPGFECRGAIVQKERVVVYWKPAVTKQGV